MTNPQFMTEVAHCSWFCTYLCRTTTQRHHENLKLCKAHEETCPASNEKGEKTDIGCCITYQKYRRYGKHCCFWKISTNIVSMLALCSHLAVSEHSLSALFEFTLLYFTSWYVQQTNPQVVHVYVAYTVYSLMLRRTLCFPYVLFGFLRSSKAC